MAPTAPAVTQVTSSMSLLAIKTRFKKPRLCYSDSFDEPPVAFTLPFAAFGRVIGWNVRGEVDRVWSRLRPMLIEVLQSAPGLRSLEYGRGPTNPLALRCYLLGFDKAHAFPRVAVCCDCKDSTRKAKEVIDGSCLLGEDWGCIRLHYRVTQSGAGFDRTLTPGWGAQAAEFKNFEVHSAGNELPRSLCGARVEVVKESIIQDIATMGGVLQVGSELFGMTVGHMFQPERHNNFPAYDEGGGTPFLIDESELDLLAADNEEGDLISEMDMTIEFPPTEEVYRDIISKFDFIERDSQQLPSPILGAKGHTTAKPGSTIILGYLKELSQNPEESDDSYPKRLNLDWALTTIEHSRLLKPNSFLSDQSGIATFSESIATQMPDKSSKVILATSRGPVGGLSTCSVSILKLPSSDQFQSMWTIRTAGIEGGDCGSWAFDGSTGNLFGMLVANCSALGEAHLLPAFEIFDEIQRRSGQIVKLPVQETIISSDKEVSSLLHDQGVDKVNITEEVVRAVAGNVSKGTENMGLLLERAGDIEVTAGLVQRTAVSFDGKAEFGLEPSYTWTDVSKTPEIIGKGCISFFRRTTAY